MSDCGHLESLQKLFDPSLQKLYSQLAKTTLLRCGRKKVQLPELLPVRTFHGKGLEMSKQIAACSLASI